MNPKLTYLIISIAFIASSCNSDIIDDISSTKGTELSFNVSNVSDISRGSVTTSINKFVVYGDVKSLDSETSTPDILFNKTIVEYKDNSWCYDGIQYWVRDYEHSFVAVAPESILEAGNSPLYLDSQLSFEYSIPASGNVDDILIATHRRLYVNDGSDPTSYNRITFTFSHLLSLINIAPAFNDNNLSSDAYIEFHKLEFSGISRKAKVEILPASRLSAGSTYDMEVDITGQEDGNYSIDFPQPVKIENNAENVRLFADDDAIIMLPQLFEADSEAKITLSYTINGDDSMNQADLPLNNLKWESGKSHIYRCTIERSGLKLDSCEINPWNVIQGEEITVD